MNRKTIAITGIVAVLCVLVAVKVWQKSPSRSGTLPEPEYPAGSGSSVAIPSGPITVRGLVTCLPHRNTSGPQTLECAIGLQGFDNNFYALDLQNVSKDGSDIPTGKNVKIEGQFVPVETLSSDFWQKYAIVGIIRVDSIAELPIEPM